MMPFNAVESKCNISFSLFSVFSIFVQCRVFVFQLFGSSILADSQFRQSKQCKYVFFPSFVAFRLTFVMCLVCNLLFHLIVSVFNPHSISKVLFVQVDSRKIRPWALGCLVFQQLQMLLLLNANCKEVSNFIFLPYLELRVLLMYIVRFAVPGALSL